MMIKSYKERIEIAEQQAEWFREVGIPTGFIQKEIIDLNEQITILEWEQQQDRVRQFDDIFEQTEFYQKESEG
jgi:hypothetical protein